MVMPPLFIITERVILMLKKLLLCRKINKFYKNMYESYYTKLQVKDIDNEDWLLEVLYDINETLGDYENRFLERLKRQIERRVL